MAEDLIGCEAKLAWAKNQIDALVLRTDEFFEKEQPLRIWSETDPATGYTTAMARSVAKIPADMLTSAGMIIQAQHDALDFLVRVLGVRAGASGQERRTGFPIASTREIYFKPWMQEKLEHISEADRSRIAEFQPYADGNPTLFQLNTLNNKGKHRDLHLMAIASPSMAPNFVEFSSMTLHAVDFGKLRRGTPLLTIDNMAYANMNIYTHLAFEEEGIPTGPVDGLLKAFQNEIASIVSAFA